MKGQLPGQAMLPMFEDLSMCQATDCSRPAHPTLGWLCQPDWFKLPQALWDRLRPGQEPDIDRRSAEQAALEYLETAR